MPSSIYAAGRWSKGICDVCGFKWPYLKLRMEPLANVGVPSNGPSGRKVCPDCWDQVNAQTFLPFAVRDHGADPQQIRDPRPDVFPIAYPVAYTPNTFGPGGPYQIFAAGTFAGYSVTVASDDPTHLPIGNVTMIGPQTVMFWLTVEAGRTPGQHTITVTDGQGNQLAGLMTIS